jgi:hypothetical protein
MPNTYVFGAGASCSYDVSPTNVHPPLATGFFKAFCDLDISGDIEVRIGDVVSYVRENYGIPDEFFCTLTEDAETFMTRLDGYVKDVTSAIGNEKPDSEIFGVLVNRIRAHDQMILLFNHVLNEIQNGPLSIDYIKFIETINLTDNLVTFNWDTLLDRALAETTSWKPDTGYNIRFRDVFDNDWRTQLQSDTVVNPKFYKLHGSTNWLVNYMTWDLRNGKRVMIIQKAAPPGFKTIAMDPMVLESVVKGTRVEPKIQEVNWSYTNAPTEGEPNSYPILFINGSKPFRTYKDRYRPGYQPFSYFFPPNDPKTDVPLMPLIVPPTKYKLYEEFAHVIDPLWIGASESMILSEKIYLIGYSLPPTDFRSIELLKAASQNDSIEWVIVNPQPDWLAKVLVDNISIPKSKVKIHKCTFREFLES